MTTLREAAQQALEALEKAHPKPYNEDIRAHVEAIVALRAALEQPEQEPVAWWNPQYGTDSYAFSDEKSDEWRVPLYTHPPRRLTDEVIADLWHKNGTYHHHFARAIERWLKGEE